MFDRLEFTSFFNTKTNKEQKELLIESDGYDNITFYFDHIEKKPSRVEFKKDNNTLSISSRMIRVSMSEGEFSLVVDSSQDLYDKAKEIING